MIKDDFPDISKIGEIIELPSDKDIKDITHIPPNFSDKEIENYIRQKNKCKFKSAQEEFDWAKTQTKPCSKCKKDKKLCEYNGNTSGTDAFDKDGYRLRRPECNDCTKLASKGKANAKKKAKELGIAYIAPKGTICGVCKKPPSKGNAIVFDHCHETDTFRGYCCNSCNRSMGVLGDNIDGLLRVLNYLNIAEKCKFKIENGVIDKA